MHKSIINFSLKLDIIPKSNETDEVLPESENVDTKVVYEYVSKAHKDIIDYIFYFFVEYSNLDIIGSRFTSKFEDNLIKCTFTSDKILSDDDYETIKEQIQETIEIDGPDTWYGSDIVVVSERNREIYELSELPKGVWFHVFYDFNDFTS